MSLTAQQIIETKAAFKENVTRTGLSIEEIASALQTTPSIIEQTLALEVAHIEDPWVLKNFLEETLKEQKKEAIPFHALSGDYHDHWFLNNRRIEQRRLG